MKDNRDSSVLSDVVYQVQCCSKSSDNSSNGTCDRVYIGQSSQRLKDRLSQHKLAIKNSHPEKSALAEHVIESNHFDVDWKNTKVLHRETNWRKRTSKERWEIVKTSDINLNRQQDSVSFPNLYRNLFKRTSNDGQGRRRRT